MSLVLQFCVPIKKVGGDFALNIFETVKQSVTTRQAAERYGIKVGRNGMACCPFHKDRTPSMKVDERYYCFGCGVTGDVIDFVASLHNLGKRDAAVKLVQDFRIDYDMEWRKKITVPAKRTVPTLSFEQRYEQTKTRCIRILLDYLGLLRCWKELYAPKMEDQNWHPLFREALQESSYIEYLLDVLLFGEAEEQVQVIAEQGRMVMEIERRIKEYDSAGTTEAVGSYGCDGTETNGKGNSGDSGIYAERYGEKQSA